MKSQTQSFSGLSFYNNNPNTTTIQRPTDETPQQIQINNINNQTPQQYGNYNILPYTQQPLQQQQINGYITTDTGDSPDTVSIAASESTLNAEAAAFNPVNTSAVQATIEEQLFSQLQNINTQMENIKFQLNTILNPSLVQLNLQLAVYDSNPALFHIPQNHLNYYNIQQQKKNVVQQINTFQLHYQELAQNLRVTQGLYQQHKHGQQPQIISPQLHQHETPIQKQHVDGDDIMPEQQKKNDEISQEITPKHDQQILQQRGDDISIEEKKDDDDEQSHPKQHGDGDETEPEEHTKNVEISQDMSQKHKSEQQRVDDIIMEEKKDGDDEHEADDGDEKETEEPIIYSTKELLNFQSQFISINWSNYESIPLELRFVSHGINNEIYMRDIVRMFERKASEPYNPNKSPTESTEKLIKKLRGVLNKMTPEKFSVIAKNTMDIVNEYASSKDLMEIIIGLILEFGIKQSVFSNQYAELCDHLHSYLPKLGMICEYEWILNDKDISRTFKKMVIKQTNDLFNKYRDYSGPDKPIIRNGKEIPLDMDPEMVELRKNKKKDNFFAIMILAGELYNVDLISKQVIYKGVFDALLPPINNKLSKIDLEGLCRLLKRCGRKLDENGQYILDKYIQKLESHAKKFDFRTKVIVDEIKEMRENQWEYRLKKEIAQTIDEIRNEFDEQEQDDYNDYNNYNDNNNRYRGRGRRGGNRYDY